MKGFTTAALAAVCVFAAALRAQDWRENPVSPPFVSVRPVFLVPAGAANPTNDQRTRLLRHLQLARGRYTEMLGGRDSFALDTAVFVAPLAHPLPYYRRRPEDGAPDFAGELLDRLQVSRFACPWILVAVVINGDDDFPVGGGRPLNGGLNAGGGIVVLSSYALDRIPNVQSTIQHELGHAFGLPHVDVYGRDMRTDASLMSYNPSHHTNGFALSRTPGILVPTDVRALTKNRRVFARLPVDATPGDIVLGPMDITGHPAARIAVTTPSGEAYGSHAGSAVEGEILPSAGPGVTFDASRMWHSDSTTTGWVTLDFEFPVPVTLSGVSVHTQHSGLYHAARRARVHLVAGDNVSLVVVDTALAGPDAVVAFMPTTGRRWRVELQAGPSGFVVVRGIRFRGWLSY